jgi:hypothetical protein
MTATAHDRNALRREAYEFKEALAAFADKLEASDEAAAGLVKRARSALFEAWTILCEQPDDEEDH